MFTSTVDATIIKPFDLTVPAGDIATGLKMLDSERVAVSNHVTPGGAQRLALEYEDASFHCSPLQGTWPDLRQLSADTPRYQVTIAAEKLKSAAAAVKLLQTDNTITLQGSVLGGIMRTSDSEHGHFEAAVAGNLPIDDTAVFDVAHLRLAAQLGGELVLGIAAELGKPTLVRAGRRKYWIARRAR